MDIPKLAILVPCLETVKTPFCYDLVHLTAHLLCNPVVQPKVLMRQSSILPKSRCELVESALEQGADYVFFIDSDMRFPKDIIHRLMAHKKQVVACLGVKKCEGVVPVIDYDFPKEKQVGLVETNSVPTGCLLIHKSVFNRIPRPWFLFTENSGEDVYFSDQCVKHGIHMFVDFDSSKLIGHIGQAVYTLDGPIHSIQE